MFEGDLRRKLEVTDSIQYEPDQLKYTLSYSSLKRISSQQVGRRLTISVHMTSSTNVVSNSVSCYYMEKSLFFIYYKIAILCG